MFPQPILTSFLTTNDTDHNISFQEQPHAIFAYAVKPRNNGSKETSNKGGYRWPKTVVNLALFLLVGSLLFFLI